MGPASGVGEVFEAAIAVDSISVVGCKVATDK